MQNASHRRDVTESGISYEPPMSLLPPGNCTREVNVNKPPQTDVKLRFPESTEIPDRDVHDARAESPICNRGRNINRAKSSTVERITTNRHTRVWKCSRRKRGTVVKCGFAHRDTRIANMLKELLIREKNH